MSLGGTFSLSSIQYGGTVIGESNTFAGGSYTDTLTGGSSPPCSFPTGQWPTAKLTYSVVTERITPNTGIYVGSPPCSGGAATTSAPAALMDMTVTCSVPADTYLGMVAYGTDNTLAFRTALGSLASPGPAASTMNAQSASGQPVCLYLPAGNYLTEPINGVTTPPNQYMAQG